MSEPPHVHDLEQPRESRSASTTDSLQAFPMRNELDRPPMPTLPSRSNRAYLYCLNQRPSPIRESSHAALITWAENVTARPAPEARIGLRIGLLQTDRSIVGTARARSAFLLTVISAIHAYRAHWAFGSWTRHRYAASCWRAPCIVRHNHSGLHLHEHLSHLL
jgi:hypothetical protein